MWSELVKLWNRYALHQWLLLFAVMILGLLFLGWLVPQCQPYWPKGGD